MTLGSLFKKSEVWFLVALLAIAGIFLGVYINRPLVDYDEATYAKVVVDTMHSGDVLTLHHMGQVWFEKPPLSLWMAMLSVSVFGENEFALRLPSILASILCCLLVYLIVKEQTKDVLAASIGFLVLLFSNSFYVYARELRRL